MFRNLMSIMSCIALLWSCESMASKDYLKEWKSLDDVTKFSDYVTEYGIDDNIDFNVVQNTVKKNNSYGLLCILTKAQYSVANEVEALNNDISSNLRILIDKASISTCKDFQITDWNLPKFYAIKWAWLLFLSQTKDYKGEEMASNFQLYPISIAEELLDKQTNGLVGLASSIKDKINRVRGS